MKIKLITFLLLMIAPALSSAQQHEVIEATYENEKVIVFRFVADNDTFFVPYKGNGDKLDDLVATVNRHKSSIVNGNIKIQVAGYCSALTTPQENLRSAAIRANRVKSELIMRNEIKEENFSTTVFTASFNGYKSAVVVTLRIPQIPSKPAEEPKVEPIAEEPQPIREPESKPKQEPMPEPTVEQPSSSEQMPTPKLIDTWKEPYRFAIRTNLLYDAFLLPSLGIEWRINGNWGVKLDGGISWWGKTNKVQKIWSLNPEIRYYIGSAKRFYVGIGGNYGEYNIYKGMIGSMISKKTGYQGTLWNAGATVGYQLPLGNSFALDLNLGLGYNSFSYDSFNLINDIRVYKDKDQTKNKFGITQAGISLVWKICK